MTVGLRGIIQALAIVCFLLSAFGFNTAPLNFTPLGLALFVASWMVPEKELEVSPGASEA
ncbi:MAG TPA: hypothetical protein VHU77_07760 [Candidatus Limnocylindria bacterium]|jgi:hypothetical protein|nr:hypothetical protein [Candidatus Limnocylindria bacterium]